MTVDESPFGQGHADPSRSRWQRVYRWLRIPVTLGLLAYLLWKIDVGRSLALAADASPALLMVALALCIAERYASALRWFVLLRGKYPEIRIRQVARLILTTTFIGYFVPGIGVDVLRLHGLSLKTADRAHAFASILVERVMGLLVLTVLVFTGLAFVPLNLPPTVGALALIVLALIALGSVVLMRPRARRRGDRLLSRLRLHFVTRGLNKVYVCLDAYRSRPGVLVVTLLASVVVQILRIVPVPIVALALGIENVSLVTFAVIVPTILFLVMIPISIGGAGVRETGYVYLLGFAGVNPEAAFSLSVVAFLVHLLSVAPGAWIYARRGLKP